jgi:hypothetical protein
MVPQWSQHLLPPYTASCFSCLGPPSYNSGTKTLMQGSMSYLVLPRTYPLITSAVTAFACIFRGSGIFDFFRGLLRFLSRIENFFADFPRQKFRGSGLRAPISRIQNFRFLSRITQISFADRKLFRGFPETKFRGSGLRAPISRICHLQ